MAYTVSAQSISDYQLKIKEISDSIEANPYNETNEEAIYKLKRLDEMYPNQWLAKYYISYCMFRRGLLDKQNSVNYFKQAVEYINEINTSIRKSNADFLCLQARIMIMILSLDPSKGAEYTPTIVYLVQEATKLEPNNSRIVFVNGLFYSFMPTFCGGDKEKGRKEFEKAYNLYKQEPKNTLPVWNEKLYQNMVSLSK